MFSLKGHGAQWEGMRQLVNFEGRQLAEGPPQTGSAVNPETEWYHKMDLFFISHPPEKDWNYSPSGKLLHRTDVGLAM